MKGIEIAEKFYYECGRPMLEENFPALLPRLAAGLAGEGSECFGFDDEISQDHDFGPGFCLWLSEEDYRQFGAALQAAYEALPAFWGFPKRRDGHLAGKRVGVFSVKDWYAYFIGTPLPPNTLRGWLAVKEENLAACQNGKIFEDASGEFTAMRKKLAYYPRQARIYKIVNTALAMGQSGQYNFARCLKRGETVAAALAKNEFLKETVHMLYLLNEKYMPFYKWAYRGLAAEKRLKCLHPLIKTLAELPVTAGEESVQLIEEISAYIISELRRQELTEVNSDFLCDHLDSIAAGLRA